MRKLTYLLAFLTSFFVGVSCSNATLPAPADIASKLPSVDEVKLSKKQAQIALKTAKAALVVLEEIRSNLEASGEINQETNSMLAREIDLAQLTILKVEPWVLNGSGTQPTKEEILKGIQAAKNAVSILESLGYSVHPIVEQAILLCEATLE